MILLIKKLILHITSNIPNNLIRAISIILFLLIFSSCDKNKERKIYISATTDVHGVIFGNDPATGNEARYSMSKISGYLDSFDYRELLVLDNGDNLQGTPSVYYYNFEDTIVNHLWPRVVNYMRYDAITVGNHDIETGHGVYDRIWPQFNAPLLAANAINLETGEPYFTPYTIIRRNGLKIAVLGLITPGVPGWLPEILYNGMEFEDMVISAQKWMPHIQAEDPDLVIGLFHSGWNENYGGAEEGSFKNENASLSVAREIPGFDIIFIGHDHDLMNDYIVTEHGDSVLVLDGGSHSRFLSVAEVSFSGKKDSEILSISGKHVKTDTLSVSSDFDETFKEDFQIVSEYINRSIAYLSKSISSRDSYFGDSDFMDLIHKIQLETSGADISFAAPLSFDVKIDSGVLKVADMFDLYRFENMLYTLELSGAEIDRYLEYSASLWFNTLSGAADDKILKYQEGSETRLLNRYYNFDSAAGIEYTVDLSKQDGNKVLIKGFSDGQEFLEDSIYVVALNSYRGSGGGGHLSGGCGLSEEEIAKRLIESTDKDLRYYMLKWIEKNKEISIESDNNWKLIPEKELERLSEGEKIRLFNEE